MQIPRSCTATQYGHNQLGHACRVYASLMQCRGYDLEEGSKSAEAEDGNILEDSRIEKLEYELGAQNTANSMSLRSVMSCAHV